MGLEPFTNEYINFLLANSLRCLTEDQRRVLAESIIERTNGIESMRTVPTCTKEGKRLRLGDIIGNSSTHKCVIKKNPDGTFFVQVLTDGLTDVTFTLTEFLEQWSELEIYGNVNYAG